MVSLVSNESKVITEPYFQITNFKPFLEAPQIFFLTCQKTWKLEFEKRLCKNPECVEFVVANFGPSWLQTLKKSISKTDLSILEKKILKVESFCDSNSYFPTTKVPLWSCQVWKFHLVLRVLHHSGGYTCTIFDAACWIHEFTFGLCKMNVFLILQLIGLVLLRFGGLLLTHVTRNSFFLEFYRVAPSECYRLLLS